MIPLVLEREFFFNFALRNSVYVETNRVFLRVEHSHNAHNYVFQRVETNRVFLRVETNRVFHNFLF